MNKLIVFVVMGLSFICRIEAQTSVLKFRDDKTFKIVQFTDLHYVYSEPEKSKPALDCIQHVLEIEKPDFIVLTGDLVFGKPALAGLEKLLSPIMERSIPFAVTWGNHDDEQDVSRAELQKYVEKLPGNLGKMVSGLPGYSNFLLTIRSATENKDAAAIYCLDSHAYSTIPSIKGYGWIRPEQIRWYAEQSRFLTERNGGIPLPALAFFHIPFPEFQEAASNDGIRLIGNRWEKVCSPALNTGLYTAMLDAKDVMGVFVGHDHDNDYVMDYNGIILGYGRYSGGQTVYNNLPEGNGARVIVLKEGSRSFKTWIRLSNGEIRSKIDETSLPKEE